jgi:hypothetical protein
VCGWILAMAGLLAGGNSPAQEPTCYPNDGMLCTDAPPCDPGPCSRLACLLTSPCRCFGTFYVDYRIRRFAEAHTSFEFADPDPAGPDPLSQLEFPLNSTWNGLEVGLENPCWAVRAEWLTPFSKRLDGRLTDRDWLWQYAGYPPSPDPSDLGIAEQRWIDGQMVDVAFEIRLFEGRLGVPISVWPVGGFRWQKFDIMAFDLTQLKGFDTQSYEFAWLVPPVRIEGDAIRFWQEYYHYYAGGQLRLDFEGRGLLPDVRLTFQGDWADIQAFNHDYHLLREGVFVTKENTHGDAWHVGVTGEIFFTDRFSAGVEGEYTQIRTAGSHHFTNEPLAIDQTWTRGVRVWSDQTAVTFFLRLRF